MKGNSRLTSEKLVKLCREIALGKKAEDAMILDVRNVSSVTDFFLICTGTSEPHLKAIADEIAANPRAVLEQLFTLSSSQSAALAKASDVHLRQKAQPIINALRSSTPGKLPIRTDANLQPDVATFSCSFMSGI